MVTSVLTIAGGAIATQPDTVDRAEVRFQSADDVFVSDSVARAADSGKSIQVYVRLSAERVDTVPNREVTTLAGMQRRAKATQASLTSFAKQTEGVETLNSFYIDNAQLVELDTNEVSPKKLASIDGVQTVITNRKVATPQPVEAETDVEPSQTGTPTYGLQQVNAPSVWEDFNTTGEGVTVGVVDTGLDANHPVFDDYNESNWAAFAFDGDQIDSEPFDDAGHGTHVAGTILGDTFAGRSIGVAPDAELYAINVFPKPDEGTTLAAIIGGIEHAIENDVDVINMSLGGGGFAPAYVDVIRNAEQLGTLIVSSSGNSGVDTTGTPANVYDAVSVGATDVNSQVVGFSTGDVIDTDDDWSFVAPEDWPETYKTPDVSAPGNQVFSTYPLDSGAAARLSGTSMASPHTAGVAALIASKYDRSPEEIEQLIQETATKPAPQDISGQVKSAAAQLDDQDALSKEDVRDVRYGYGIVDAYAAFTEVEDSATIEGTVLRGSETLAGAEVSTSEDGVRSVRTDANGTFSFDVPPGEYELSTSRFGLQGSETVTVEAGGTADVTIETQNVLDVALQQVPPDEVASGNGFNITAQVATLSSLTVDLADSATVDESNVTVSLAGNEIPLGQALEFEEPISTTATLAVSTTAPAGKTIALNHTFGGPNDELLVTTGPTTVLPSSAQDEPLSITKFDPPSEVFFDEPSPVFVNITNTGDFTEQATIYHRIEASNGNSYTLPSQVSLNASETVRHELGPYNWGVVGGPGTVIEHQVAVGAPPTRLGGNPEDETEIEELVLTGGGTITGQVTDSETGDPVSGATVTALGPDGARLETTTDSAGNYTLTGASKPGTYDLTVTAPAYGTGEETVTVTEDKDLFTADLEAPSAPVYELELDAGTTYSLGIPGPVNATLDDILQQEDISQVLQYNDSKDLTENPWEQVGFDTKVGVLDAYVVIPSNDTTARIEIAGEPGSKLPVPGDRDVEEGWNFVAPSTIDKPEDAFVGSSEAVRVLGTYEEPRTAMAPEGGFNGSKTLQLSGDRVSPFAGYFVFFDSDGKQSANLYEGITRAQANENLNIETAPLTGTVKSSVTGEPIAGATVEVAGASYSATTGPDGQFQINHVPTTVEQSVTVSAENFASTSTTITQGNATIELTDESYFDVTSFSAPEAVSANDQLTAEYTVTNKGAETRERVVQVALGPNLEAARVQNTTNTVDSRTLELAPGERKTVTINRTIDVPVLPGPQNIGVITDATGPEPDTIVSKNITLVDATLRPQALDSAREVLITDVGADAGDRIYVVYEEGGELQISGTKALSEARSGGSVAVPLSSGSGLPGLQSVFVVTDAASSASQEGAFDPDGSITAGPLSNAPVMAADLRFWDQEYDEPTDSVTIDAASLRDGFGGNLAFSVKLHPTDENGQPMLKQVLGSSEPLTGTNEDVTVQLDEPIEQTDDVVAMLHFDPISDSRPDPPLYESVNGQFVPVTDRATVTVGQSNQVVTTGPETTKTVGA
jgi:subtilisin family serine protease